MKGSYWVLLGIGFIISLAYFIDINRLFAGDAEKKTVEEKKTKLNDVKLAIVEAKAKVETTMKDLKAQRDVLKQKIKDAHQEFQTFKTTLNGATKKAINDYQQSLRSLKASAKIEVDRQEADDIANKAIPVIADIGKELDGLNSIDEAKPIDIER